VPSFEGELPLEWSVATIGDLISAEGVFIDGDWVESKDQDPNGDVRLIQLADVADGFYKDKSARFLTKKSALTLNCTFLKKGDVLIARMPDPLGRACIFPGDVKECVTVVDVCIVRTGTEDIDNKWIMYWVNSPRFRNTISSLQSGTTRRRISRGNLATITFPVPPPEQQKRIVAKIEELFSHIDAGTEALRKAQKLLKQYRQSVLKAAVTGELTKEWREANKGELEPASQLLERILKERRQKWEEQQLKQFQAKGKVPKDDKWKGKYKEPVSLEKAPDDVLPESWSWVALGEVFDVHVGATPSRKKPEYWDGNLSWVSSGEVAFCRIKGTKEKITKEGLNNSSTELHPPGTIMLGMIGEGKTRGQVAILDIQAAHNQNTAAIEKYLEEQSSDYLYFYLMQQYEKTRKRGSGNNQKALNKTKVQAIEFPLSPLKEQRIISELLLEKMSFIERLECEIASKLLKAEKSKQSILISAFSGVLVDGLDSDGSAEELLENIKQQKMLESTKEKLKKKRGPTTKKSKPMAKKKIIDVLKESEKALLPEKLFDLIGADGGSPDEVEAFYIELKGTLSDKHVLIEPVFDNGVKKGDLISYKVEV